MHILHEGVKRGVAEKQVHEALATWDKDKKGHFHCLVKQKTHMYSRNKEYIDIVLRIRSLYYLYPILNYVYS